MFGCNTYYHIPSDECGKLDTKARKCIFIGYGEVWFDETERYSGRGLHDDNYNYKLAINIDFRMTLTPKLRSQLTITQKIISKTVKVIIILGVHTCKCLAQFVISTRAPRGPGPVLQIYIYNMPSSCACDIHTHLACVPRVCVCVCVCVCVYVCVLRTCAVQC